MKGWRMVTDHQSPLRSALRWGARRTIAVTLIPLGLAIGVGGIIQEHLLRHRPDAPPGEGE